MTWKLAFYGTGERAQPYLRALARRSDVHLVAACDLERRAAEQTAAGWRARVFLSYEAMLQESRPDALFICVEPHLQGDVILKAAEMGVPFFVEPPGAVDFTRADLYSRVVAEKNLVTAVGYSARHTDVVCEGREYVGANRVPLVLGWWMQQSAADTARNAATVLGNDASRLLDAARFYCGEVARVRALAATGSGIVVQLEFASGTVGVVTCAIFARPEPRVELEFLGEGWSLLFGDGLGVLRLAESDKVTIIRRQNDPAADQAFEFLDAVAAGDPSLVRCSYPDARSTMALCHAAALSAESGAPVELANVSAGQATPPATA
jgi:predicted dehydrogenase